MSRNRNLLQLNKKKDKKRKRAEDSSKKTSSNHLEHSISPKKTILDSNGSHSKQSNKSSSIPTAAQEARSTVQSAVESNPVLSNLFGSKKKSSEKERRDALFTRNC
jgi:hypothetical protein